jgi:hypothetical protein
MLKPKCSQSNGSISSKQAESKIYENNVCQKADGSCVTGWSTDGGNKNCIAPFRAKRTEC